MIKNKKGQSMVEVALVLPVLVLIMIGIIEFGLIFKTYIQISYGANEISRAVSLDATSAEVSQLSAAIFQDLDAAGITTSITPATAIKGQPVTVVVTYSHKLITPLIGDLLGSSLTLKGKSVVIKE